MRAPPLRQDRTRADGTWKTQAGAVRTKEGPATEQSAGWGTARPRHGGPGDQVLSGTGNFGTTFRDRPGHEIEAGRAWSSPVQPAGGERSCLVGQGAQDRRIRSPSSS